MKEYICMDCWSGNVVEKELRKFHCPRCGETGEYKWPIGPVVGNATGSHFCSKCGSRTEDKSWKSN